VKHQIQLLKLNKLEYKNTFHSKEESIVEFSVVEHNTAHYNIRMTSNILCN